MSVAMCGKSEADPAVRERRMRVLVQANAAPLRHYLLRLANGQHEAAEDLLQETMLRTWRKVDELPGDALAVRRWLFTVARNVAIDAARARTARPVEVYGEDGVWTVAVEDEVDRLADRNLLHHTLIRLPEHQREVLVALYYRGASVTETARRLGVPEGTVRSRAYYGLRTARDLLNRMS